MDTSILSEELLRAINKDNATHFCKDLLKNLQNDHNNVFGYIVNASLLCIAAEDACKCMMALLRHSKLKPYLNINTVDNNGDSPLHRAIKHNRTQAASILLKEQVPYLQIDISTRNHKGETALDIACEKGLVTLIGHLTQQTRSHNEKDSQWKGEKNRAFSINNYHYTALIKAVDCEREDVLDILLSHGIDANVNMDDDIGSALHCAAENGSRHLVCKLLDSGADIESIRRSHMQTPLMLACQYGHLDTVNELVIRGAHIDRQTDKCSTALTVACHYGFAGIATYLLEQGADPSISNTWGFTALYMCTDCPEILERVLCHQNVDVNERCGERLEAPLHLAAVVGCLESFQLLLQAGANLETLTKYEESPLWLSIWKGHKDVATLCIQMNSNRVLDTPSNGCEVYAWKYTPLELALGSGQTDIAYLLYYSGSKLCNNAYFTTEDSNFAYPALPENAYYPPWIRLRQEVLHYILNSQELLLWFCNCLKTPRSLLNACVIAIRNSMSGARLDRNVDTLPIPLKLKSLLKLQLYEDTRIYVQ